LVSRNPLKMRVDARCNDPKEADPKVDRGATIYSAPGNDDASRNVGRVRDNTAVDPLCFVPDGDPVSDASHNSSPIWIKIATPAGYIPDVNLGGGFTQTQLESLGLAPC
jgi:hypothetical protein